MIKEILPHTGFKFDKKSNQAPNPVTSPQNAIIRSCGCLEEHRNLLVNQEWLTGAFRLVQTTLLNPYVNVTMQILANMSRKVAVLLETNEQIPMDVSWGFSTLLVKKGMDIVLPLTHWKGCLQTITLFISLRAGTFFFFSHYFSLFHSLSSSPKHLHSTTTTTTTITTTTTSPRISPSLS